MSSPFLKQVFNKDRTFRPKRKFEPGTQRFELHKKAQASLNAGLDLKLAVQLPAGEDLHDWVAVHVVDFFNRVNLIYGTISDGCTEQSCPVMSGGPKYEYRWQDEHRFRKPTALSAPRYMDLLMDWIEAQINNEELFPTSVGESGAAGGGVAGRAAPVSAHGLAASAPSQGCQPFLCLFPELSTTPESSPTPLPSPRPTLTHILSVHTPGLHASRQWSHTPCGLCVGVSHGASRVQGLSTAGRMSAPPPFPRPSDAPPTPCGRAVVFFKLRLPCVRRLFWVMQMDPKCHPKGPYEGEAGGHWAHRREVT